MSKSLQSKSSVPVPRDFVLLDCIERSGQYPNVTYGIAPEDENNMNNYINMEDWNGTIIFDDGENLHIVDLKIKCTNDFPNRPPIVTFPEHWMENQSISILCNNDGSLKEHVLEELNNLWDNTQGIGDYLVNLSKKIKY